MALKIKVFLDIRPLIFPNTCIVAGRFSPFPEQYTVYILDRLIDPPRDMQEIHAYIHILKSVFLDNRRNPFFFLNAKKVLETHNYIFWLCSTYIEESQHVSLGQVWIGHAWLQYLFELLSLFLFHLKKKRKNIPVKQVFKVFLLLKMTSLM